MISFRRFSHRLPLSFKHLTRRLYWKVFIAFWAAMTLAGMVLLFVETTRTSTLAQRWRGVTGDAFGVYASSVVMDHEDPKTGTSREFLANLEERTSIRAWLFDARNREVSGHAKEERSRLPVWLVERMGQVVERARGKEFTEFADLKGVTLAARAARAPSGQTFVLVGTLSATRYDFWGAESRVQTLRFLAMLATAGLVSWLLARHLTQPLEALRAATHRIAAGDFSARATSGLDRRRDELADLATDFNSMAERLETLLREQERLVTAQRRLLGDVAHELRSPLARAAVALELARDSLQDETQADTDTAGTTMLARMSQASHPCHAALDRIERETGRLSELIQRLLMLSRLESGVQKPELAPIDLASLVQAVVADADFEARSHGRRVQMTTCEALMTQGVSSLLRSAIENVVRNASRYTAEGTSVEVVLQRDSNDRTDNSLWQNSGLQSGCYTSAPVPSLTPGPTDWAIITVRDRGSGVPSGELGEVFRPFYRAAGARERHSGGAGLGLSITARAIELHGGQFRAYNASEGGLVIELRLPLASDNESTESEGNVRN